MSANFFEAIKDSDRSFWCLVRENESIGVGGICALSFALAAVFFWALVFIDGFGIGKGLRLQDLWAGPSRAPRPAAEDADVAEERRRVDAIQPLHAGARDVVRVQRLHKVFRGADVEVRRGGRWPKSVGLSKRPQPTPTQPPCACLADRQRQGGSSQLHLCPRRG